MFKEDITRKSDTMLAERIYYDNPDFPAFVRKNYIPQNPCFPEMTQWHDEVEFITVFSGSIKYNVNGEIVTLREGEGIFVNAKQLHVIKANYSDSCGLYCVILHPVLLCSSKYAAQKYVSPIIENQNIPYLLLSSKISWQADIISDVKEIYECTDKETAQLRIVMLFHDIWEKMYSNINLNLTAANKQNPHLSSLKDMITYIQEHYMEKITIKDISNAGNVGKTTCNMLFKKYTNYTPVEYITNYRLQMSLQLMQTTDLTITEIYYQTGFSGASYFSETFHKHFGCTPRKYRKSYETHTE